MKNVIYNHGFLLWTAILNDTAGCNERRGMKNLLIPKAILLQGWQREKRIHTSYVKLLTGILWNIWWVTWIFSVYTSLAFRWVCIPSKHKWQVGYSTILYTTRDPSITIFILRHRLENALVNTMDVIPSNIQPLSCTLIGCNFYGMA